MPYPGYSFSPHYATVGGQRMHYLDEGSGDPVVMLHGNPNWVYYWRNLIPVLKDRFRCLAPDHIGCGLSDKPDDAHYEYRLKRRIDDLEAWLDGLGVRGNISLVVHDWGGMIGCGYAVRHPERIKKLVILNTAAFRLPKTATMPRPLLLARSPGIGAFLVRGLNLFSLGATRRCVTRRPMPRDVARAYCAPYDSWKHRIAVHRFVQDIPLKPEDPSYTTLLDVENRLASLADKPMLLGWGFRDFVFDEHFFSEWKSRFPDAEIHEYRDCGHYVLEDAGEELISAIRDFLSRA